MATIATQAVRAQWDEAAAGWNAHGPQIGAWLARATEGMLGMAGIGPGSQVLDVAAGAGEQTLVIADRVGPQGRVLATDLSPAILALARDNALRAGLANVRTQVVDGEDLRVAAASFDAAVCRLGLMLFPDPLRGLLAPRDPFAPGGLLSLGRPGLIGELFAAAGFEEVATTTIDAPFRMPSVQAYLDFVRSSASPIQQILGRLDPQSTDAAWAEMEERLSVFTTRSGWEGPNELLLTAGRKPRAAAGHSQALGERIRECGPVGTNGGPCCTTDEFTSFDDFRTGHANQNGPHGDSIIRTLTWHSQA